MAKGFKQASDNINGEKSTTLGNVSKPIIHSRENSDITKSSDITSFPKPTGKIKLGKGIKGERERPNTASEYHSETTLPEDDISLKEYLEVIYNLEKRKYEINSIIEKMRQPINPMKADYGFIGQIIFTLVISFLVIFLSIIVSSSMMGSEAAVILFMLPAIYCIYRIIKTLLNTHKSLVEIRQEKEYNQSIPLIVTENKKRIKELEDIRTSTVSLLCTAYSRSKVHTKYQNLVAISSLYEYIDTGRCNKLEGIDGAYNLFENEIKTNTIITQLNIIIDELEQIRINQRYLYEAFVDTQYTIDEICSSVHNIEKNSALTAYTAKVIEYNQFYQKRFDNTFFVNYRGDGFYGEGI